MDQLSQGSAEETRPKYGIQTELFAKGEKKSKQKASSLHNKVINPVPPPHAGDTAYTPG